MMIIAAAAILLLPGCGKKEAQMPASSEAVSQSNSRDVSTVPEAPTAELSNEELIASLPYKPGSLGIYVMAAPNIEAGPEVLDSISFEATDGEAELTRYRVSNRQHDLIKNGKQIGGWVLTEIPREMLDNAADNFDGFKALTAHLGEQLFPSLYPEEFKVTGGGHVTEGSHNSFVIVSFVKSDGMDKVQYVLYLYVGEEYCYILWHDSSYFADSGERIMQTLSAGDIKPEQNHGAVFNWTVKEIQKQGKFVFD